MSQSTIVAANFSQVIVATNELIARGDYKKAVAECDNLISMYSDAVRALRARAHALERLGDAAHALDDYRRVLEVMPTDYHAMSGMARCHKKLGEVRDAEWWARQVIDYDPENLEAAHLANMSDLEIRRSGDIRYARELCLAGMPLRGISEIRRKLNAEPERVDLHMVLAELLWTSKQTIAASEKCQEILHVYPDCLPAHLLLRALWQRANAASSAYIHTTQIARLDPDRLESQAWLQASLPITAQGEFLSSLSDPIPAPPKAEFKLENPFVSSGVPLAPANSIPDLAATMADEDFMPEADDDFDLISPSADSQIATNNPPAAQISVPRIEISSPFDDAESEDLDAIGDAEVQIDIEGEPDYDREAWINDLISTSTPRPAPPSSDTNLYELEDGPVEAAEPLEWSVVYNDEAEVPETDSHLDRKPNVTETEPEWLAELRAQSGSVWVPANDDAPQNAEPDGQALTAPPEPPLTLPDLAPPAGWITELATGAPAIKPVAKPAGIVAAAEAEAAASKRPKRPSKKDLAALEQIAVARQNLSEGRIDASTELYTNIIKNGRKLDEVVQDLSNVAKTSQHSARLYRLLGDAYTKQGNLNAALAAYQQGLRKRAKG